MGIFDKFKKDKIDWNSVKSSVDVYPENSISVIMFKTDEGNAATGWVDNAYIDYKFKKYCPFNLQFSIEINDKVPEDIDMSTIEDYFVEALKKGCIVHPVARMGTEFGFIMDIYVDDSEFATETLQKMYADPNKLVEFGCGFNHDPQWKEYARINNMAK